MESFKNNYRTIINRCPSPDPKTHLTFKYLFEIQFPSQYTVISKFLSVSTSLFSTFTMNNDFKHEDIEFPDELGPSKFGKVTRTVNKVTGQKIAVKEYSDINNQSNKEDFLYEYVALKAIDHPKTIKIYGAIQRKDSVHGSRLIMEFASHGDLRHIIDE